jgi:4-amino-4-deoxy-L-arabinose transferase-like glycosyltransferase
MLQKLNVKLYWWIFAFFIFYVASGLIHLGYFPLNNEEPRRAIVSIEMLNSGNYIMPTTMGWEYYNKPPVYNWIIALFMSLSNSTSEIPVRLPSLIFLLAWAVCNYYIIKRFLPASIALLSSLFLLTSFDIYFWGLNNGGEIDIFYSFVVYLQVILMFYFNQYRKWLSLYTVSYLFCAIGFLTKGFPSLLFEGFTLLALCVYNKSIRLIFKWQHFAGMGVLTVVIGSYLYAYSFYSSPGLLLADLLKESFNKSAFGEYSERLVRKIIEYPFSFLKILLPWSLILILLFKKHRFKLWDNPTIRFSILFILFNIPVYWFTGHPRMRYVYMFLPFAMIILAYIFYEFKKEFPVLINKIIKYSSLTLAIILTCILILPFVLKVNYVWFAVVAAAIILYLFQYRKASKYVWYASGAIIIVRIVYAAIFIPIQYDHAKPKYDHEMAVIATANKFQPISIYKPSDTLNLVIDLKVSKLNFGTIPTIPHVAYQMPYYYYRYTGNIVQYDTILQQNKNYIGYRSGLRGMKVDILYSFKDENQSNDEIMLFSIPSASASIQAPVKNILKN